MHKEWINRAVALLNSSLYPIPQELNELDWKEQLSPNKERLCEHLSAFANHPGGGFLVFGIRDIDAHIAGISRDSTSVIIQRLADIGRNTLDPPIGIDHSIETYEGKSILLIYIKESSVKPVF